MPPDHWQLDQDHAQSKLHEPRGHYDGGAGSGLNLSLETRLLVAAVDGAREFTLHRSLAALFMESGAGG